MTDRCAAFARRRRNHVPFRHERRGIRAAEEECLRGLAAWAIPLYVVYIIAGFVFGKKIACGRRGVSIQWLDDSIASENLEMAVNAVFLVALVVAFIVVRRRRLRG